MLCHSDNAKVEHFLGQLCRIIVNFASTLYFKLECDIMDAMWKNVHQGGIKMNDRKERKIFRLLPCYRNDILAIEAWLEDMAAEGYMLKKFNGPRVAFTEQEPMNVRYRLLMAPKGGIMNVIDHLAKDTPTAEENFIAVQEVNGWHYITRHGMFLVFVAKKEETPEPERNIQNDLNKVLKNTRNSAITIAAIWMMLLLQFFFRRELFLLNIIRIGTGFYLFMLLVIVYQIWEAVATHRIQKRFAYNIEPDDWRTDTKYKKRNLLDCIVSTLIIVGFLGMWLSVLFLAIDKPNMADKADAPFPLLAEIAPELTPGGNGYLRVDKEFDILAPVIIRTDENNGLYDGEECVFSGWIEIDYYETLSPWLARHLATEYVYDDGALHRRYGVGNKPEVQELYGLDVDYACTYETYVPVVLLVEDNVIMHISFNNQNGTNFLSVDKLAQIYADYLLSEDSATK